ncbi:hypothetical protein SteCoe_24419 [Stentor coeruleus]|uniref:RING-type domain-containing protein n=1 Tax=Stentor coeruleus TaxID=5963 RepID=A0A1R2BHJ8_9CILI|nr:hypothetical protein SteCoe_24419 [Stentor coeruleus]
MSKHVQLPQKASYDNRSNLESSSTPDKGYKTLLHLIFDLSKALKETNSLNKISDNLKNTLAYFKSSVPGEILNKDNLLNEIEQIQNLLGCDQCKKQEVFSQIPCGHTFCENCMDETYSNSFSLSDLKCTICEKYFYPSDISEDFLDNWIDRIRKSSNHCKKCMKISTNMKGCKHFCDECLCLKYRRAELYCEYCSEVIKMPQELFYEEVFCSGCKCSVFIYGDYAKTLQNGTTLCYICLKECQETRVYPDSRMEIGEEELKTIAEFLYSKCNKCYKILEEAYFVPKQCCQQRICGICQAPEAACVYCSQELDAFSRSVVEKYASIKRLIGLNS